MQTEYEIPTYTKTWATVECPDTFDAYGARCNHSGDYSLNTARHICARVNGSKIVGTWEREYEVGFRYSAS